MKGPPPSIVWVPVLIGGGQGSRLTYHNQKNVVG